MLRSSGSPSILPNPIVPAWMPDAPGNRAIVEHLCILNISPVLIVSDNERQNEKQFARNLACIEKAVVRE
jgi:hypothetical protein